MVGETIIVCTQDGKMVGDTFSQVVVSGDVFEAQGGKGFFVKSVELGLNFKSNWVQA